MSELADLLVAHRKKASVAEIEWPRFSRKLSGRLFLYWFPWIKDFIVANDPDTVLALIAVAEEADKEYDSLPGLPRKVAEALDTLEATLAVADDNEMCTEHHYTVRR